MILFANDRFKKLRILVLYRILESGPNQFQTVVEYSAVDQISEL
jgi:hypothetical protein